MSSASPVIPVTFASFACSLLSLYEPPLRARSTYSRMAQLLDLLGAHPGVVTTADLTTPTLALWIADRSRVVCVNTVIGELGYLQTACEFAVEEGWLRKNPFLSRRLRVRKEPTRWKRHHTLAEVGRVLTHLRERSSTWKGNRLYALASTVAYTGLRRNEALFLLAADVDLPERLISVVPRGKNRLKTEAAAAPVAACEELAEVLADWLPRCRSRWLFPSLWADTPWTGGNPGTKPLDRLRQAAEACGVSGMTWLSLRHSWATHAETAWGLSEPAIQRMLRHTSPITSRQHYRHADADNLRAMVRSVSYRTAPV
jgi:integrase